MYISKACWGMLLTWPGLALAQQEGAKRYAHVDFVRPAPGKAAEYRKAVEDKLPVYQKSVTDGKFVAWLHYARAFPHGSGQDWSQVRLRIANTFASAFGDANSGIPAAVATSVSGELWELVAEPIELPAFLKAKYVVATFRKMANGITSQTYEAYINGTPRSGTQEAVRRGDGPVGTVVFRTMFPSGARADYDYVTLNGYNDLAKVPRPVIPPDPARAATDRAIRSTVRMELWQQTARTE